jgi:hypothetical protein
MSDEKLKQFAVAFRAAAQAAMSVALSPVIAARYKARAFRPQIGDTVLEVSSFRAAEPESVGRLLMANPSQGVWRILTLYGQAVTWENAEFVAAPDTDAQRREFTEGPV